MRKKLTDFNIVFIVTLLHLIPRNYTRRHRFLVTTMNKIRKSYQSSFVFHDKIITFIN